MSAAVLAVLSVLNVSSHLHVSLMTGMVAGLFLLVFIMVRTSEHVDRWAHLVLTATVLVLGYSSAVKGGLPSVSLGWGPVVIVLASLVLGCKGALLWTILTSVAFVGVWLATRGAPWDPALASPLVYLTIRVLSLWVVFSLTRVYETVNLESLAAAWSATLAAEERKREVERVRDKLAEQNPFLSHARQQAEQALIAVEGARVEAEAARVEAESARFEAESARFEAEAARAEAEAARVEAEAARAATEEALRARSTFIANMSHEIRTPINAVLGISRMMATTALDPQQREYNRIILDSGKHLLHVINQGLDICKVQGGHLVLESSVFNLAQLVESVVDLLQVRAVECGIALRCEVGGGVPMWVRSDPGRLRQVLINIAGNALKFTKEGEVVIRVRAADEGRVLFGVSDTGIGIPEEAIPTLFDAFTQADSSTTRRYGGTGLGLAISQEIVRMLGGEITVRSKVGKGSTFMFIIPLEPTDAPAQLAGEERRVLGGRVLLVEDNEVNQQVARFLLEGMGIVVTVAENGLQALEAVSQQAFDLILMDCYMPVMDGFEAASRISRQPSGAPPIVALSASALDEDRQRCSAAGMSGFVSKPIDPEELRQELATWLVGGPAHAMSDQPAA